MTFAQWLEENFFKPRNIDCYTIDSTIAVVTLQGSLLFYLEIYDALFVTDSKELLTELINWLIEKNVAFSFIGSQTNDLSKLLLETA